MSITIPESPLENRIAQLELENKRLHDTVAFLTRQLFGRSSEKTIHSSKSYCHRLLP